MIMKTANVAEFKNQLSRFLALVVQGEEIEVRKHNVPLSRLVPINPQRKNRTILGCRIGNQLCRNRLRGCERRSRKPALD